MAVELLFERVWARSFRNIAALELVPSPHLNVIAGDNGQGKTSLLEALYFVATSRSFRTDKPREVIAQGAELASVRVSILEDGQRRDQRAVLGHKQRSLLLDGKKPARLSAFAVRTPVVVFHPGDLALASGPAQGRRTLLDRLALFLEPASADHRLRYTRAQRGRQRVLEERGARAVELEALEQLMAEHGAAFARARALAAERLAAALVPAFERMAPQSLSLEVRYLPGGSSDSAEFAEELARRRSWDLKRKKATYGPQRDEVDLVVDGRSARRHASQGQQRLLTLALKAAELGCLRDARDVEPVLLLDDVSSELDPTRTGAVYRFLRETRSQVFVTTTRPELFVTTELGDSQRADFSLKGGALVAAS